MKTIVITGALDTEYVSYTRFSWKYEIIAIDNRFVSERVNELKEEKLNLYKLIF